jgi:predicted negative regulator of RcsB-dependent stress response
MMDHETAPKQDDLLKKQALEAHEVQEVLKFLKRYGKLIGAGLLAAAVAAIGSRMYASHKADRITAAEQMLMNARAPEQLEEIVTRYKSTPTAPVALLNLARVHFNGGETAQARTQYERFLKEYKNHEMRPVAELGLAYCTEADGDFAGAAAQFADFAKKNSTSYLRPMAVLGTARCNQQAGQADEARIVLEDFLAENGNSMWAGLAQTALKTLNETSAQ